MDGRGAEGIHDLIDPSETVEGGDIGCMAMTYVSSSPISLGPGIKGRD